ncbi:hypothetical protein QOK77_09035 [Moraxella osloensis]|nr:hypothetical protein [Moraxella osloensis]MDK1670715.1 hypothetical protein [Moraxella osloensis]
METSRNERQKRFCLPISEVVSFLSKELNQTLEETIISLLRIERQLPKPIPVYRENIFGDYEEVKTSLTEIIGNNPLKIDFQELITKPNNISDTYFRTDYLNEIEEIKEKGLLPIDKKVIALVRTLEVYQTHRIVTTEEMEQIRHGLQTTQENYEYECQLLKEKITYLESQMLQSDNVVIAQQQNQIINLEHYIEHYIPQSLEDKEKRLDELLKSLEDFEIEKQQLEYFDENNITVFEEMETLKSNLNKANSEIQRLKEKTYEEKTKNSVFHLIYEMKGILLNQEITGSLFSNSDNDNSSKKPSQSMLAEYIAQKKLRNLSKRNIDDIFARANKIDD